MSEEKIEEMQVEEQEQLEDGENSEIEYKELTFDELKEELIVWMKYFRCDLDKLAKLIDRIHIERETGIKVK